MGKASQANSAFARKLLFIAERFATDLDFDRDTCVPIAVALADVLRKQGFAARPAIGFATWRVGRGNGDVVTHHPQSFNWVCNPAGGFMGHAWVRVANYIVDSTTRSLPEKLAALDSNDRWISSCEWAPRALVVPVTSILPMSDVVQGYRVGACNYEERPELATVLAMTVESFALAEAVPS